MTELQWGSCTHVGYVRVLNEDSLVADPPVFAVADGMGGHAAGEVASDLALSAMRELVARQKVYQEDVLVAIETANQSIVQRALKQAGTHGMGTTLTGLCLALLADLPHWVVFNIGDSRVYRLADGVLRQLTTDHSEVEEMVAAGRITHDEARTHPDRNIITRSLGTEPAPVPDLWLLPFTQGDTFLICSDGLTTEVPDDEIGEVLAAGGSAQEAAEELCRRALLAGGRDNISVVVVRVPTGGVSEVDISTAPRGSA